MSIEANFSEKPAAPQPYSEPENMTTIELNKNGYFADDIKNVTTTKPIEKLTSYTIMKSLIMGIGLFILLGLCVTILILMVHRGSSRNVNVLNETSPIEEMTFKILLSNRDQISACKISKSYEDCCYIFFKATNFKHFEKCTVQKVLNLFLQYEVEANKRSKRQNYRDDQGNYENHMYPPYYYQENNIYDPGVYDVEYPNNVLPDNNEYYPYGGDPNAREFQNTNDYYHNPSYYQTEYPKHFYEETSSFHAERQANSGDKTNLLPTKKIKTADFDLVQVNLDKEINAKQATSSTKAKFDPVLTETTTLLSSTLLPKNCPDDNCPTIVNASTKIANITNLNAESGQIRISVNDTKIQLSSKLRNNLRVSQSTDFEPKSLNEAQSSSQNRQVSPCFYSPYAPQFGVPNGFNPNPLFGMVPLNPNFQQQPLYMINPPIYPSGPQQFQSFNQNSQVFSKNSVQMDGRGQFYMCRPVSSSTNNLAGMPSVDIRRMSEAFTLQDLVENMPKARNNNKTREALECPLGTHPCRDSSKCIHDRQLCDNEVNCHDASDEMDCSCKNRVGELRWCDGYLDCPAGEDENNCFDCGSDEISCDDWSRFQRGTCVPLSQRCDGIKQCEITGKDEEDCFILTDHLGQHPFYKISNAAGFLHRNYKGKWYPTCFGSDMFAVDLCRTEAGPTDIIPTSHLIPTNDNYPGPFLDFSPQEGVTFADTCMRNKAAFVECPPMYCGLRLTITNPFRNAEVDTSAEEFLNRRSFERSKNDPLVGDSRVVGGKASQPTAWPWIVSIYKNGVFHCGGVVINELWILTAAHCVDRFWLFYYEIQAGILRRFSYSPMEQARWAAMAIPHENYNKRSLKNDIALMKLSKPVRFNRYVKPICLPSEATAGADYLRGPKPNTVCVTVGWGAIVEHGADPDHLREVEIPILSHCKHTEDQEGDEICAGLLEGGRDACQGDSGGPLMCQSVKNRSQWYLAGIVSHGEGCARPDEPGVYTKVSKYIGWINENLNGKSIGRIPLQKCPGYVCTGTRRCIPKKRHCDRIVDCLFGDDEFNCWQSYSHSNFRSAIVGSRRNLFRHLLDILDLGISSEEDIIEHSITHKIKKKLGNNTATFTNIKSDLNDTIDKTNFICRNILQTIPFHKKCDKVVHCEDGTDETECSCVDFLERYHKEAICDGVTDCRDMSDETNCEKCLKGEYLCRISQKCIPSASRCDGRTDCINAEDEWDCVALTDGRTLVFDSDLRPKQSMKGIITINRFGVWRPLCTNGSVDDEASIAANVCNLLGFEEYTVFHKLSVPDMPMSVTIDGFELDQSSLEKNLCSGLFLRCLNISLVDTHKPHQDNFTNEVELYTAPWNAVIYVDGKFRCTGTILNPHWIITVGACFQTKLQIDAYIAVLLGKGKAHLDVEGPHEQIILINDIAAVEESDAIVLQTKEKINFSRYIKPARITIKSRFVNEQCVAIGFHDKKMEIVILEAKEECSVGFRCFTILTANCKKKLVKPWSGVISCNSGDYWYPAAIYENIKGPCDFVGHKFPSISNVKINLAMGNDLGTISPPECAGFRCLLGECIKKSKVCDGVSHCRTGEDEDSDLCFNLGEECNLSTNCTKLPPCKRSHFRCKNGQCIPKTSFCDTINDCKDNYDEPEVCSCRTYMEIVHPEKICDGTVNCWDRSDEQNCTCQFPTNITCARTDRCISQKMVCDGFRDCPDGDDEGRCYSLKTNLKSVNSGEVLKLTAGVWHSGCFTRNHTTSELEEICQRLGFVTSNARLVMPPKGISNLTMQPVIDSFDVVRIRRGKSGLQLRLRTGNEPYVKFIQDPNCYRLFIECLM